MTDETKCTGLSKFDGRFAKFANPCCLVHDDDYSKRRYWLWLRADFKWMMCCYRRSQTLEYRAKSIVYGLGLMTVGWIKYYDIDKFFIRRFPALKRFNEWLG